MNDGEGRRNVSKRSAEIFISKGIPTKMSEQYQTNSGGINEEEEFVDVRQDQFIGTHYEENMNPTNPFSTTIIGTTDVQYAKNPQGEVLIDEHRQQPEEVYYDGEDGDGNGFMEHHQMDDMGIEDIPSHPIEELRQTEQEIPSRPTETLPLDTEVVPQEMMVNVTQERADVPESQPHDQTDQMAEIVPQMREEIPDPAENIPQEPMNLPQVTVEAPQSQEGEGEDVTQQATDAPKPVEDAPQSTLVNNDNVEDLVEQVLQMGLESAEQEAVNGHAGVPSDAITEATVTEQNGEDPSTPIAVIPPNSPRPLSELMAVETQYPIPYRSKLTEPFEPGQTLIVKGKTAEDSVRFTINLHHSSADFSGNDVPLHISVRFDEGKMVFNTFSKGEWGKEERKSNPYKKGEDIDIRIRAHDSKFTIYADQKEIKEYEHRVPLSSITHFSIDGDVLVTHIHWGGKYYPVPYESGITGDGFNPGKTMLIFGTPEKKGKRFHINLLKKNGDIALHFNPRFDEKAIVRNSLIANEWGNEEREGKNPLEKGIGFDLKIVNEEYAFQIFINDDRFCSYAHRMEPHDIHGLQIGGDVEITGIQIF